MVSITMTGNGKGKVTAIIYCSVCNYTGNCVGDKETRRVYNQHIMRCK